ncbi:MAG: response regulator [Myxococcales bacterium]|nr:response regulator [Myxococcales bacterium]TDI95379.1 MAG: response regulator [Deltaproteobacteria bacterium]
MRETVIKRVQEAGFQGCKFVEAADGTEALEALDKHDVDLILSDINMPRMNGIQLVRRVREPKLQAPGSAPTVGGFPRDLRRIPIVMISTDGSTETVQAALAAGANSFLRKPFTADQLKEKLEPLLS